VNANIYCNFVWQHCMQMGFKMTCLIIFNQKANKSFAFRLWVYIKEMELFVDNRSPCITTNYKKKAYCTPKYSDFNRNNSCCGKKLSIKSTISTRGPRGPWNAHLRQKIFKSSLFSLLYVQQATLGGLNLKAIVLKFKSNVCKRNF